MVLIDAAIDAWRKNDLALATQLMFQAVEQIPNAQNGCLLACVLHQAGRSEEARSVLRSCIAEFPFYHQAQDQYARITKELARRQSPEAQREISERRELVARARAVMERDAFLLPRPELWNELADKQVRMLDNSGIANFKRTIGHLYQSSIFNDVNDPHWTRLRDLWEANPLDQPLLNTVEAVDGDGLIWDETFPTYPLSEPQALALYKFAVGVLWELALQDDKLGFLADYEESTVGNPIRLRRNERLISQDAAQSARELNQLFQAAQLSREAPLVYAELGAGLGRLAEMLGRTTKARYMIFDIPPALAVSQWYLQQLFPNDKVFAFRDFSDWSQVQAEVAESRFAFFTPNQLRLLPNESVDVFIDVCSLMEMKREQVQFFLDRISQVTRRVFFSKRAYGSDGPADPLQLTQQDLALGRGFSLGYDQPDAISHDLSVQVWLKDGAGDQDVVRL